VLVLRKKAGGGKSTRHVQEKARNKGRQTPTEVEDREEKCRVRKKNTSWRKVP